MKAAGVEPASLHVPWLYVQTVNCICNVTSYKETDIQILCSTVGYSPLRSSHSTVLRAQPTGPRLRGPSPARTWPAKKLVHL